VVGVDDVVKNDPRRVRRLSAIEEEEILFLDLETQDFYPGDGDMDRGDAEPMYRRETYAGWEWTTLDNVLYNVRQTGEYVCNTVVGLIINPGDYDSQIWRVLAAIDEKYMSSGSERIPVLDPNEHPVMFRRCRYTEEDVRCNRFVNSVVENMPEISRGLWKRARYYLLQAGWDIPEEQLRYLLVWNWL
jgi:hypothetical protein